MIVYSRFSPARKSQFRLSTIIEKKSDSFVVSKISYSADANNFLASFSDKYRLLKDNSTIFEVLRPYRSGENKISFDYSPGISLHTELLHTLKIKNKEAFIALMESYASLVRQLPSVNTAPESNFIDVFGEHLTQSLSCITSGCLDLNLDNILKVDNKYLLIDYEWTFSFPIPIDFIIFRAAVAFYGSSKSYFPNSLIPLEELLTHLHVPKELFLIFFKMEASFQNYVMENPSKELLNEESLLNEYEHLKDDLSANLIKSQPSGDLTFFLEKEISRKDAIIQNIEINSEKQNNWIKKLEEDSSALSKGLAVISNEIKDIKEKILNTSGQKLLDDEKFKSLIDLIEKDSSNKATFIEIQSAEIQSKNSSLLKLYQEVKLLSDSVRDLKLELNRIKNNS